MNMIEKVKNTIEKNQLLNKGDKVVVGLSGGADSITLISVLCALREEYELTLSAVHVNHLIRGDEAERDENFVIAFCKERNIPLTVFRRNIPLEAKENGEGEEECGRRVRYECFSSLTLDGGKIATAHTLSDSIETMIFNMLRGSSAAGLCSIPVKRDNIIRPLIDCSRDEIEKYCDENNLSFVTDSTNLKSDYTRNYIRREIMPMFSKVNEAYAVSLSRLKDFIYEDNAYLEKKARELLSEAENDKRLDTAKLISGENVLIKRALVIYIKRMCGINPESRHINIICEKLSENFTLQLSKDFFVCIENGKLFIKKRKLNEKKQDESIHLLQGLNSFCGKSITAQIISHEDFLNNHTKLFENAIDCDKINGDVFIRSRREGDSIFLKKRKVTKSLKKLFCEIKLPVEERDKIPIVADETKVLWVYGVGVNGDCAADKNTKNFLIIK